MLTSLGGGEYSVSSPSIMKTFSSGSATAQLMFNLNHGTVVQAGSLGFLNLTGMVTSLMNNALPGFDYSLFASGTGSNTLTLTTSTGSFSNVIANVGASLGGSGLLRRRSRTHLDGLAGHRAERPFHVPPVCQANFRCLNSADWIKINKFAMPAPCRTGGSFGLA